MPLDLPFSIPFALSDSAALLLSALLVSMTLALIALIRNRRALRKEVEEGEDLGIIFQNPSSILPHVVELRQRLLNSVFALIVGALVGLALSEQIIDVLSQPIGGREALLAIGVTEPVRVFFKVALVSGAILASPFVIAQLWIFVAQGLKKSERRLFYFVLPMALILFLSGVAFAYFVMLPVAIPFLLNVLGFRITPTPSDYLNFVTSVLLWMGIAFELPMVIFILARMGIVNAGMLLRNWRFAIVGIAFIAAAVTPTVDPVNMGIVMLPLFALYLLSIILAVFARRRHPRAGEQSP